MEDTDKHLLLTYFSIFITARLRLRQKLPEAVVGTYIMESRKQARPNDHRGPSVDTDRHTVVGRMQHCDSMQEGIFVPMHDQTDVHGMQEYISRTHTHTQRADAGGRS